MRISFALAALLFSATPALAAPEIVVDTPITGSLVQHVMGDLGTIHVLMPAGTSVHHHQMRPSDAGALQDADALIWTGPELTPWLERASRSLGQGSVQLRLLDIKGTTLRSYDDRHADQHDEDHGHGHGHADNDPHAWLNPENTALWLSEIAKQLGALDSENAAIYSANAQAVAARLDEMDSAIRAQLAPVADKHFVVFHDAYGYFTDHYGLSPALAVSPGDASTPSAARISELRAAITESGATCAFPEFAQDTKLIVAASEGTGIKTGAALDPEGAGIEAGPMLYGHVMQGLADSLTDCLSAE
ncbi:zinc ABC transporter substrate-binding protein [Paracoccus sp. 11-3]|uniref:High-affinity zinc uptake system protein ZnuA n=1 Tax=Paracoccus amoyensis TaxID=2760093 RepID=A0A926GBJ0_9RHOB|nr:zinc ABC transporter substrate-binding protein [Paracoccus amoyensis]MBC9246951.1 zinc ABC transporter substrate-binding protein [Paracoccus amoyensis]